MFGPSGCVRVSTGTPLSDEMYWGLFRFARSIASFSVSVVTRAGCCAATGKAASAANEPMIRLRIVRGIRVVAGDRTLGRTQRFQENYRRGKPIRPIAVPRREPP